ncbi:MAG: DUF1697 domain-containing protein [Myxococcaceae bacterium]
MALVVFLRGINVGGHKSLRPTLLAEQLKRYGVVNLGAAGTFVVRRPISQRRIRAEFERRLPFQAEVIICRSGDLLSAASATRFDGAPQRSDVVRFVSVLSRSPLRPPSIPFDVPPDGKWFLRVLSREGRFLFGVYRRHMQTIRHLGTLDRLFGGPITTRSWSTITAIVNILLEGERS